MDIGFLAIDQDKVGVFMGTGVGGISLLHNHSFPVLSRSHEQIVRLQEERLSGNVLSALADVQQRMTFPRRINPFIVSMLMPNAISANVGLHFGVTGPNTTYAVACAAGTVAIGNAYRAIKR